MSLIYQEKDRRIHVEVVDGHLIIVIDDDNLGFEQDDIVVPITDILRQMDDDQTFWYDRYEDE